MAARRTVHLSISLRSALMPSSFLRLPTLQRAFVGLLVLVAASYMLAPRSVREAFIAGGPDGTGVSSTAMFVKSSNLGTYRKNLSKLNDVRDDANDVLVADTSGYKSIRNKNQLN